MDTVKKDWMIESEQGQVMGIYEAETADDAVRSMHAEAGAVGATDADGKPLDSLDGWKVTEITDHLAAHVPSGDIYAVRMDEAGRIVAASGDLAQADFARALAGDWDPAHKMAEYLERRFEDGGARLLSRDEENARIVR